MIENLFAAVALDEIIFGVSLILISLITVYVIFFAYDQIGNSLWNTRNGWSKGRNGCKIYNGRK